MNGEILIKNGFIINGTGTPGFNGDILVRNGKIAEIASNIKNDNYQVIDAGGKAVCPGFIDPHVHEELPALGGDSFKSYIYQGVTTTVNGNCGHSLTPGNHDDVFNYMCQNGLLSYSAREKYTKDNGPWSGLDGFAQVAKRNGPAVNMAFLLGHGTIRWYVMNGSKDRDPTESELIRMCQCIKEGMESGAVGLSTGLAYIPGIYSKTEELIACARVVAQCDGVYASHLRSGIGNYASIMEAIEIGQKSGARVQVSHFAPSCVEGFEAALEARDNGLEIAIDTIPKSSGHLKRKDRLIQFIMSASNTLFGKDKSAFDEALKTPEGRADIVKSTRFKDIISVVKTGDPTIEGKTLKQIAKERNTTDDEVLLDLLENGSMELTFWQGGMNRGDFPGGPYVPSIASNPIVSPGSDRIFGEIFDPTAWYELFRKGAFPIFFANLKASNIRTEEIIRRMTALPAQQFRFTDRGLLLAGFAADISIIDLENYSYQTEETIDYCDPHVMASGVDCVLVNGVPALLNGELTENRSGQLISSYGRTL